MWSFRRTPRTSRPDVTRFRARLSLESLDARLAPSDLTPLLGEPPARAEDEYYLAGPDRQGTNRPPQIVNFGATEVVGGMWRFTGDVIDEAPGGLTITFGGEPISLQGVTVTTDANGHFDKVVFLNTDGTDNGLASAQTVDGAGQQSNLALYIVMPG